MRRVVKVGGSLLLNADLPSRLSSWLSSQQRAETLMIVGGGELIDAMRRLDRVQPCDPVKLHWRCVDLLQTTFQFMKDWFPAWHAVESAAEFRQALDTGFSSDRPTLIAVDSFYRADSNDRLPTDWRTTTDAIAGLLAIQSASDELVLLKSCPVDDSLSINDLAAAGIVDQALPLIADQVNKIRTERLA